MTDPEPCSLCRGEQYVEQDMEHHGEPFTQLAICPRCNGAG